MILLDNASKRYESPDGSYFTAVDRVSLSVHDGEVLVFLGSSGSGKSTLLNLINHSLELSSGAIIVNEKPIQAYSKVQLRRSMGFVFQHTGLFPHMTVARNISIIMRLMKVPKQQRITRIDELLELVKLEPCHYRDRYPDELSGGEQQRVGVARALAVNPDYLLMDEPFAALDAISRESLQDEVIELNRQLDKTILFVTHDINEAFRLADRIAIMHQGQLQQIDTKEKVLANPATPFVRQLLNNK